MQLDLVVSTVTWCTLRIAPALARALALIGNAAIRTRLLVQRLYHEVRHALNHLYVKPCQVAASSSQAEGVRQWQHWSSGAGLGAVIDQQDLPGPQGTKQLHLRRKEGPDEEELNTVSGH